ncbi:MAG TPA: hypothetical protein VK822_28715, partial [Acetobacteraceae bacterium]|nr:hypothetical protein [Acetobacteraceae bacterium]
MIPAATRLAVTILPRDMPNSPSTCGEDLPHRAASDDDLLCGISGLWRALQMQKPSGPRNSSMSGQL